MEGTPLTPSEKTSLTDFARKLVDRGRRAGGDDSHPAAVAHVDAFSDQSTLARVLDLEQRMEALNREWSRALNAALFTIDHLERRVMRLDGEIRGLHEAAAKMEEQSNLERETVKTSAEAFVGTASDRLQSVLDRVEALLAIGPMPSERTRNPGQVPNAANESASCG